MILGFASFITRHLIWSVPAAMVGGFAYGLLLDASPLKWLVLPLTFLMVYPMMINLKINKIFEPGGAKVQWATQALNFLVIPFIALGSVRRADFDLFNGLPLYAKLAFGMDLRF